MQGPALDRVREASQIAQTLSTLVDGLHLTLTDEAAVGQEDWVTVAEALSRRLAEDAIRVRMLVEEAAGMAALEPTIP